MKKIICFLMISILLLSFAGCSAESSDLDSENISDEYLRKVINAIIANDEQAAYATFVPGAITRENIHQFFLQIKDYWNGSKTYTYKKTYINAIVSNKNKNIEKQVDCKYNVYTGDTVYIVTTSRVELNTGASGLLSFNIVKEDEYLEKITPTGTLDRLNKFNTEQWALLVLSVLVFLFTIFTIVDCLRHDIKLKWLWAIGILLLYISLGYTKSGSDFMFNFFIHIIGYSKLFIYPDGKTELSVLLPVVSIVYWCLRKKLIRKTPKPDGFFGDIIPSPENMGQNNINEGHDEIQPDNTDNSSENSDERPKDNN
jgi:hypothetical protein